MSCRPDDAIHALGSRIHTHSSEESSPTIRLYDGRGSGEAFATISTLHRQPCHLLAYNEVFDCAVSADIGGMVEYWRPEEPFDLPSAAALPKLWRFKSETDLLDFKKAKAVPTALTFSRDGTRLAAMSLPDRQVRLFSFLSGRLLRKYDESLQAVQEMQQAGTAVYTVDEMEFGRRLAVERELDSLAGVVAGGAQATEPGQRLLENGAQNASGLATSNAVFDESGNFLIYACMLGIKGESIASGLMK